MHAPATRLIRLKTVRRAVRIGAALLAAWPFRGLRIETLLEEIETRR
jgi:hypothetical protein